MPLLPPIAKQPANGARLVLEDPHCTPTWYRQAALPYGFRQPIPPFSSSAVPVPLPRSPMTKPPPPVKYIPRRCPPGLFEIKTLTSGVKRYVVVPPTVLKLSVTRGSHIMLPRDGTNPNRTSKGV